MPSIPAPPARAMGASRSTTVRFGSLRDLAKFTTAVALLAIFADAALGHALLWENDPYWTYWVTKTFLIATVFGLGTAWIGAGIARGALIAAVHTVVLTVYYWSLSPIGLPSHPEWLDLQHTWVTGVPVHFAVIYLGYLTALWLWQRRESALATPGNVASSATRALAVGAAVVVASGTLEMLVLGDFPGVTWFIVRLLIAVPFTLVWWAAAGRDLPAAVGGALILAFTLIAYSHFLGPVGLPSTDLRVIAQAPPPSPVRWLSYSDEFLVALPITLLVALAAFVATSTTPVLRGRLQRRQMIAAAGVVVLLGAVGVITAQQTGPGQETATVMASEDATVEIGEPFGGDLVTADATLRLVAENRNPRVTPLPPHDVVDVSASVAHPDGKQYEITASQPMIDDPKGRFGTWWGVGLDSWHHGRSGIGTAALPDTRSDVAVFALGEVTVDGALLAHDVPVHVMTKHLGGVELHVGDPSAPIDGLADGHLRTVWSDGHVSTPESAEQARNLLGSLIVVVLLAAALLAVRSQQNA